MRSSAAATDITIPGVQKPHCSASVCDERVLHRMHPGGIAETFDGRDLVSARVHREDHARRDRLPVEMNRARAARAAIADQLRAGHPKMLAQGAQQSYARLDRERHNLAVYFQFHSDRSGTKLLGDAFGERGRGRFGAFEMTERGDRGDSAGAGQRGALKEGTPAERAFARTFVFS